MQEGLGLNLAAPLKLLSEPLDIVINQKVVGIRNCSRLLGLCVKILSHTRKISIMKLKQKVLKGQHNFNLRPNASFLFPPGKHG